MTHRLATNYAKNYCNRTTIVKVIVENVVTCFFGGHSVCHLHLRSSYCMTLLRVVPEDFTGLVTFWSKYIEWNWKKIYYNWL